jgi:hypothetical protein
MTCPHEPPMGFPFEPPMRVVWLPTLVPVVFGEVVQPSRFMVTGVQTRSGPREHREGQSA